MKIFVFYLLVLIFFPVLMFSQNIKGKITDEKGIGIPGALIFAIESNKNSEADIDGNFTITAKEGEMVEFTMIGFEDLVVPATLAPMQITMIASKDTELKEVVVIGYGTRKKVDNTGAISQLKTSEITKNKVANATQGIQGKAAGVQVIGSDTPGGSPTLVIRGIGTALSGRNPLFVVDGIVTSNITNINPNDIETYDVLKDASSLAIYGNQAANGVVIITTKKGKNENITIEYDGYGGVKFPLKKINMADANSFANYSNIALINNGNAPAYATNQLYNTDWFDESTKTTTYNSNNLSLSGRSDKINYLFSLNNYQEKGILPGMDYQRLTLRTNNNYTVSDKFKISQTFSTTFSKSKPKPYSAFTNMYNQSPIVPVKFPNGRWGMLNVGPDGQVSPTGADLNNVDNPVAQLNYFTEENKTLQLQATLGLDYQIIEDLKFTSKGGFEYNTFDKFSYVPSLELWLKDGPSRIPADYSPQDPINELYVENSKYFNWNWDNYFTYNKAFSEVHDLEITLGMSAQEWGSQEALAVKGRNVPESSNYWSLNLTSDPSYNVVTNHSKSNQKNLVGYFSRFQYKLKDRYLLTGTIRRDGSSQFNEGNRWGTFPSFGLGWVINEEDFLKESKTVNSLKLRGGWGRLGNQNIPLNQQTFASGTGYTYNFGNGLNPGTTITTFKDPSLGWEVTEEISVGLDFKLLDSRLSGTLDWYNKETTNVILYVAPPTTAGTFETPTSTGIIKNDGYEITLRWEDTIGEKFKYWIGGNFSQNKNLVSDIDNPFAIERQGGSIPNGQYTKKLAVGEPIGSFYLYEVAGYDAKGNFTYYDKNGVATSSPQDTDRKFFGSSLPTHYYGFNVGLEYKGFDFSIDTYGVGGNYVYNGKKAQRASGQNIESSVANDYWTTTNTNAANPAPSNNIPISSNYFLESGAFFRVNNITIGYKLPEMKGLSFLRFYITTLNPFISQKFTGYSPELNGDGDPLGSSGIELDAYPALTSFLFGANIKF
jgi:TonB-linked SusC/RagA family outer membrane protein